MKRNSTRLVAFGLDGVPFKFLKKLLAQGHMPFLKSLVETGSLSRLKSTKFPLSAVAWSSAYTGMNPAQIGACGFVRKQKGSYLWEYVNPSENAGEDIWQILARQNYRCVLIGPLFYEVPENFNGVYIGGEACGNQDNPYTAEEVGQESIDELVVSMKQKFQLAANALQNDDWDFAFVGFLEPDTMHAWYHCDDEERLVNGYRTMDALLRDFVGELPEDTSFMIYSDHGNKPYDKALHVNSWLYTNGYLRLLGRRERLRLRCADLIRGVKKVNAQSQSLAAKIFYTGLFVGRTMVRSFPRARRLLLKFAPSLQLPPQAKPQVDKNAVQRPTINPGLLFDYSETVAYASLKPGGTLGGIYLNRVDKDPLGTVAEGDYLATREKIAADLRRAVDERTGTRLVKEVWFREEVYKGPYAEEFPDIVFAADETYFTYISEDDISLGNVTFDFRNCQHEMDGMLICAGPAFCRAEESSADLWDTAPTLLSVLGTEVPPMDGRVLSELLTSQEQACAAG